MGIAPTAELIEIYDESGRVELVGTYRGDIHNDHGCLHEGMVYDLSGLRSGEYVLVHRRSSAPPGLSLRGVDWSTYEGETALVTTLVLTTIPRDGG